ncbi:hypothetical protein A5893_04220 [Pedobacter psychrophilus]|uniref:Uncharacterized protein n=1 Tax=Pedobacter psychrophilus TaxID=1826909 RepID=A0A179DP74_9SPHI|nr:hypothetical protein [Pedobacter psychrophilus]OAQ42323.1 hypothetical protein A5893_04220 [Pedobacter psychrophilus]
MKRKISILIILQLSTLIALAQKPNTTKSVTDSQDIITNLKKTVDQKWIRPNPKLKPTKLSFFNTENAQKYFVGLLQISGFGIPFTWDDDFTLVGFLSNLDKKINVKKGTEADPIYKGTKIKWRNDINGLVWFNGKTYKSTVDNWHLFGINDCPGTIMFPNLSFKKVIEIPNAVTNSIQGLSILPYDENIKIKSHKTTMTTENGKIIQGIGYDLNNDSIFDVFSYEEITTGYKRLYLNIGGQWKCKWIHLDEECI